MEHLESRDLLYLGIPGIYNPSISPSAQPSETKMFLRLERIQFGVLLVMWTLSWACGRVMSQSADATTRARGAYLGDRAELTRLLAADPQSYSHDLEHWLRSTDASLRGLAYDVSGASANLRCLPDLINAFVVEHDRILGLRAARAIWRLAFVCRQDPIWPENLLLPQVRWRRLALRDVLKSELVRLASAGTEWSDDRRFAPFLYFGEDADEALASAVNDESLVETARALAAIVSGRMDAPGLFVDAQGSLTETFQSRIRKSTDLVRTALIYALAATRPRSAAVARFFAEFACSSCFCEEHIEACLYLLQTLPDDVLGSEREAVRGAVSTFLQTGHSERVVFQAANLLLRLGDVDLARRAASEFFGEEVRFVDFFVLEAVLPILDRLPAAEADEVIRSSLKRALVQPLPQIRVLAGYHWERRFGAPPTGFDRAKHLMDVERSARESRSTELDADFFAQRSAAEVAALTRDPLFVPLLRELLNHSHETVRLAAALQTGQAGFLELRDELAALGDKPAEYAAFGAAVGLKNLGDPRAIPIFLRIMESGNNLMAEAALYHVQALRGQSSFEIPANRRAWLEAARTLRTAFNLER